jgi:hypothetical protein
VGPLARTSKVLNGTSAPCPKVWTGTGHRGSKVGVQRRQLWKLAPAGTRMEYEPDFVVELGTPAPTIVKFGVAHHADLIVLSVLTDHIA